MFVSSFFNLLSLLLSRMSLKCRAVKMLTHDNSFSVHDDHDDKCDDESESDSAAVTDTVYVIQCHLKCSLQSSLLHHSVAADNSIIVNTSHALSAFKPFTASIKDASHSASSVSHFASFALHFETFIFTSFCLLHLQSIALSSAAVTVQTKHLFFTSLSTLIQSHALISHSCVHCLKNLITSDDYNSGNCIHSAHDQKCSYCSIQ